MLDLRDAVARSDIRNILDSVQLPQEVKRAALDAFYSAETPRQFLKLFDFAVIPQEVKASLWDAKFGGGGASPNRIAGDIFDQIAEVLKDPDFLGLPTEEQRKVLSEIDAGYRTLPAQEQLRVLGSLGVRAPRITLRFHPWTGQVVGGIKAATGEVTVIWDDEIYVGSVVDYYRRLVEGMVHIQVQTKGKKKTEEVDPQDWVDVHMMEIPGTTQRWVRPDLGARTQRPYYHGEKFDWTQFKEVPAKKPFDWVPITTHLSFLADVDGEELISAIQNQVLYLRPKFSIGDSLVAHRFSSLIGLAFLTAGLFSLGWYVRSVLRAKRAHSQQMA